MFESTANRLLAFFTLLLIQPVFGQVQPPVNSGEILLSMQKMRETGQNEEALIEFAKVTPNDTNYVALSAEACQAYLTLEQYEEAGQLAQSNLKKHTEYDPVFFAGLAISKMETGAVAEALPILDRGIALFPRNGLLHYNRALALEKLERYDDAVEAYFDALDRNINLVDAHYRVGKLAAAAGYPARALLSWQTVLFLEPHTSRAAVILEEANQLATGVKSGDGAAVRFTVTENTASKMDQQVNALVAISKKYKTDLKPELPLVKQQHLIFSMLPEKSEDGYWARHYFPFWSAIKEKGQRAAFLQLGLARTTDEKAEKVLVKNRAAVNAFIFDGYNLWRDVNEERRVLFNGVQQTVSHHTDQNGQLQSIGNSMPDGKTRTGHWEFYHPNGAIGAAGKYNREGLAEGVWNYYYGNGRIKEEANYVNGKQEGAFKTFSDQGVLTMEGFYRAGRISGKLQRYYSTGGLSATEHYQKSRLHGKSVAYHPDGALKLEINYQEGVPHDTALSYFDHGQMEQLSVFLEGEKHGPSLEWHKNGNPYLVSTFENGKLDGEYKLFHSNGAPAISGMIEDDKPIGIWKAWYRNGQPRKITPHDDNGIISDTVKYFRRDGRIWYFNIRKDGFITESIFFDQKGDVLSQVTAEGKQIKYTNYYENDVMRTTGLLINDNKNGLWTDYDKNGTRTGESEYKDDVLHGISRNYYVDGAKASEIIFENGNENGLATYWHPNGEKQKEGYYDMGAPASFWNYYRGDGTLDVTRYYVNGYLHGLQQYYGLNGEVTQQRWYDEDMLQWTLGFDSVGQPLDTVWLENSTGTQRTFDVMNHQVMTGYYKDGFSNGVFRWYYGNGELNTVGSYRNDQRDGKWTWYDRAGKRSREGIYKYGMKDSVWNEWTDGQLAREEHYEKDDAVGTWRYFYPDGKKEIEAQYEAGERHGRSQYFSPEGDWHHSRIYRRGQLVAYISPHQPTDTVFISNETDSIVAHYPNGKPALRMKMEKGRLVGQCIKYYASGQVWNEISYEHGNLNGPHQMFFPDGTVKLKETYLNDYLHGTRSRFHPNGTIKTSTEYRYGERHGKRREYDLNGNLLKTEQYFNDRLVSE